MRSSGKRGNPMKLELQFVSESRDARRDGSSPVDDARLQQELLAAEAHSFGPVPALCRRFQMTRVENGPALTGRLNDPAWRKAVPLTDFAIAQGYNELSLPRYAEDRTEAFVLYDDKGLYVGVRAYQDPTTIYTVLKGDKLLRPDIDWEHWSEEWAYTGCDEVEITIDPELTQASHYTFHMNPDGVRQKTYMPCARVSDGLYKRIDPVVVTDDKWRAVTSRDEKGWCAEAFIPWESIGFQPIRPVSQDETYFNMVQERTVLGLNVNRVSHARHEASSWSPSKGAMFFRDAEHFGHAYFRTLPAALSASRCGDFAADDNMVAVTVRSQSDSAQTIVLRLAVSGASVSETTKRVTLAAGETREVAMEFKKPVPGLHRLDVRLEKPDGYLLDRVAYSFVAPAPVDVTILRSILWSDESDFPVRMQVNLPHGTADSLRMRVLSGGKAVAAAKTPIGSRAEAMYPFELSGLAPGEYVFEAAAMKGGTVQGVTKAPFRVEKSPFQMRLAGTAGKRSKATGGKLGFEYLASGNASNRAAKPFDGTIAYLDGELAERSFLLYSFVATEDFYNAPGLRMGGGDVTPPRKAQLTAPIRAFAAGDEYEAVSFAVFALADLESVRVEYGELRSKSGAVIPTDRMDLRAERPDRYMVKEETLGGIARNDGRRYMLTVHIAPGTPAGLYEGTLTLTADGVSETKTWQLLVLPFALGAAKITASVYGAAFGDKRDEPLMRDLLAHGIDNYTCFGVFKPGNRRLANSEHIIWGLYKPTEENTLGNDPQLVSLDLDENVLKSIKKEGLRRPMIVDVNFFLRYVPCTEENAALFKRLVERVEALRKKHGLGEFIYHLVDEPANHYTYDDGRYGRRYGILRVRFFGKVLKEMGLRQYVVINSTQHGYDIADKAADVCDIWCPNYIADESLVDNWAKPGHEIWLYNYAGDGRCKGALRSTYGFYAPRVKASGVTIWHHPDFVTYVPEENKVLDSSPWEAGREGIDDARYMATLSAEIEKARAKGGRLAKLADAAARDMAAIVGAYPATTGEKVLFERKHDADQWNKWRWIMARWVVRLGEGK